MATSRSDLRKTIMSEDAEYAQGQVFISLPSSSQNTNLREGGKRLEGLLQGEFNIAAGNQYNTPLASSAQEALSQAVNIGKSSIETIFNIAGQKVDLGGQIQLKTLNQTSLFWTGSKKPTFNIDLLFIAVNRGDDVRKQVQALYEAVFPTLGTGGVFLKAPLGYSVNGQGQARGTFAIQLGTWFRATKQVMTDVQFTYSQEMVPINGSPNGTTKPTKFAPLYARGSITFEPYRDILFNDFKGYFLNE